MTVFYITFQTSIPYVLRCMTRVSECLTAPLKYLSGILCTLSSYQQQRKPKQTPAHPWDEFSFSQ